MLAEWGPYAFAAIGLLISAFSKYLAADKLWVRKHIHDVADSVSIASQLITLASAAALFSWAIIMLPRGEATLIPLLANALAITVAIFRILVGLKIWVPGMRTRVFDLGVLTRRMRRVLREEREEVGAIIDALAGRSRSQPKTRLASTSPLTRHLARRHPRKPRLHADHPLLGVRPEPPLAPCAHPTTPMVSIIS